ncbi:MAG TPA: MlaD family protein [Solirubrobacteraceae bacterium]|jgi:phospholipid/cholesterol/gamma-HCH transport system substrate-binding protein
MNPAQHNEGGRGLRDQLERYRTAFLSVIAIILVAAFSGGYILAHERLSLPSWFPVLGHSTFTLKAEFQTAQAVTPGQGQAVTIAGAKVGEIASVQLVGGRALVNMNLTPKYARYIYRDATMLLRPKTQLKDMTVEVDPGTPRSGRVSDGEVIPIAQTAPDVNLDEFLASLDADTRAYLQLLLAGAAEGLHGNGRNLSAAFKRFDPLARDLQQIGRQVAARHANVAHSIHNFQLVMSALGGKDKALEELIDSSNAVLGTFAREDQSVQETLRRLPGTLAQANTSLDKLTSAARVLGPTLTKLQPFAKAFAPAQEQTRPFLKTTTPIIKNQIRPFTSEIQPVVNEVQPDIQDLNESFPKLSVSLSVINELLNEIAYNPSANQPGFLFYLDWLGHNLNSVFAAADANGPLGHGLLFIPCQQLYLAPAAAEVNPPLRALLALTQLPTSKTPSSTCPAPSGSGVTSPTQLAGRVFGRGLQSTYGLEGTH